MSRLRTQVIDSIDLWKWNVFSGERAEPVFFIASRFEFDRHGAFFRQVWKFKL